MSATGAFDRATIEVEGQRIEAALAEYLAQGVRLVVVRAPPGSGKTRLLIKGAEVALATEARVAIGAQTNSQANDICLRLIADWPDLLVHRFAAGKSAPHHLGSSVLWVTDKKDLPPGPCVVVSTIAKWGLTDIEQPFDFLFVDEAWQMAWSEFMLCGQVSDRFVLIGDPGQIPPVVPIPVGRWETSPRAPHQPAPAVILDDAGLPAWPLELPASHRLPHDTVDLIRYFYDFPFGAWALPGERSMTFTSSGSGSVDDALDRLSTGSVAALTLPTPPGGPPLELDAEVAELAAAIAVRALERGGIVTDGPGESQTLAPAQIGLVATHRVVNTAMRQALPTDLRESVMVDTPERWQGLERTLMIAVHPLSGVTAPSAFDLETGRLCVMASRHRVGLVMVGRDHISSTLETHIPSADQAPGRPDVSGRGHEANLRFWETLLAGDRVVSLGQ